MRDTLPPHAESRHYSTAAEVAVASYAELMGVPTDGARHQREMKLVADFFTMVEGMRDRGKVPTLTRLFELFCDEMDQLPAPPIDYAIRKYGRTDRLQDESREECLLDGMTYGELSTLKSRTHAEIAAALQLIRSIAAHIQAMPLEARV